ncbi:nuclear transport factor 2 family protein [Dyella flagellata]|uniref:nuclear transport factor 2 family protein n=1 Tax=Dyella flagellata TaxID=1867833 RepID=UPI0024E07957|nr:nuclear transport factor 2 family protein [Dyella flagellata]
MNRNIFLASVLLIFAITNAGAATPATSLPEAPENQDALFSTISNMDAALFDAFNHCSSPDQLKKHASYLNPNLEFYHDKGGVTWTRQDYIDKTRENVCGHFRRVLTKGSLRVFPIKDYGAIEEGHHAFCEIESGKCFGEAKFLIVWHHSAGGWEATRIFSYGHQAIH